jgi:uncharacterized protein (TIGR03000 family)
MYSLVLMMAASTAPDTANFGGLFMGCHGCHGASAGQGCYGSCYGSGHGGLWLHGSCHGYGFYGGCYGGGYGGCCAAWAGYGSCYGGYAYGGCHGYGIYGGTCLGGLPGSGCYGYGMPQAVPQEVVPGAPPAPKSVEPIPSPKKTGLLSPTPTRAAVTVALPADARLYAEGAITQLTSAVRDFLTPELVPGQTYRYTFRVEYNREGKTLSDVQDVFVKAGERTRVEFKEKTVAERRDPTLTASK